MIKLLFGLCRQRASVNIFNLPINVAKPYSREGQVLLQLQNICKPISSICTLYLNSSDLSKKVTDSMTSKGSSSSSPEVVELHRRSRESPRSTAKSPLNQKRKRKTVAESLKDNVRKWEASHSSGKKRGKSSSDNSNSPDIVELDSTDKGGNGSGSDSDDLQVIEVIPKPKMHKNASGAQQGHYSQERDDICNNN